MAEAVIKHREATIGRIERFITDDFYTKVNLRGRLFPHRLAVSRLYHFPAQTQISHQEALRASYEAVTPGSSYGPTWSTHWFRLELEIPEAWIGQEVRLIWDSDTECMVWENGRAVQGLSGSPKHQLRTEYLISKRLTKSECSRSLHIEMACTGMMGEGCGSEINPPDMKKKYHLRTADLVVVDTEVRELLADFDVLLMMAKDLKDTNEHRANQAMFAANKMINIINLDDRDTFEKAREISQSVFSQKNGDSQLTIHAMGHCHIDCAWLWDYDETIRKCGRSWSATVRLMESYPDMVFTCSQAQQYQWVKDRYPEVYSDIKRRVAEGRFIPVGGTWVEMDGNLPSGESFVRQVLYGQRFFLAEFGKKCTEFWLPDTFGYSAQLPQIISSGGMSRFLTQKICWCVNKFPHHTFIWEGLDGSRVLTHFPPGDCYHMYGSVEELMKTANNCEDKGRVNNLAYLYGYGDGGGGPTEEMLERLKRLRDVDGIPKVKHSSPDAMFSQIESTEVGNLCRWVGELYLEFHQGTYTSQSKTKWFNRKCEFLLRDVEMVAAIVAAFGGKSYPYDELERIWKLLLLNQFHDVLPGSSINKVYEDSDSFYEDVYRSASKLLQERIADYARLKDGGDDVAVILNTLSWARSGVVEIPASLVLTGIEQGQGHGQPKLPNAQHTTDGNVLVLTKVDSCGVTVFLQPAEINEKASVQEATDKAGKQSFVLENGKVRAVLDNAGRIMALTQKGYNRNAILEGHLGNQFVLFEDTPVYWDAWDVNHHHLETRKSIDDVIGEVKVVDSGPLRVSVEVKLRISDESSIKQLIVLNACEDFLRFETKVDWHEDHKFLKVEFPLNVRSQQVAYETQFGYLSRPTHWNTKYEWMKFEVCGHKWADLSEPNFGVALMNDCKYGYSCHDSTMRLSLLKAPKSPDENADMGVHSINYGLLVHANEGLTPHVTRQAYSLNCPLQVHVIKNKSRHPDHGTSSHVACENETSVVLDTVKLDEDRRGWVILRMYETYGTHASADFRLPKPIQKAKVCNILEEALDGTSSGMTSDGDTLHVELRPFQILTVAVQLQSA